MDRPSRLCFLGDSRLINILDKPINSRYKLFDLQFLFHSKVCANCKCPRENHDVSVDVDLDGVEFKIRGLNIQSNINKENDLPAPPSSRRQNYNDYSTVKVTKTESSPVDNDFLPPPPPPASLASDYIWSPPGLTAGQVRKDAGYEFLQQVQNPKAVLLHIQIDSYFKPAHRIYSIKCRLCAKTALNRINAVSRLMLNFRLH